MSYETIHFLAEFSVYQHKKEKQICSRTRRCLHPLTSLLQQPLQQLQHCAASSPDLALVSPQPRLYLLSECQQSMQPMQPNGQNNKCLVFNKQQQVGERGLSYAHIFVIQAAFILIICAANGLSLESRILLQASVLTENDKQCRKNQSLNV